MKYLKQREIFLKELNTGIQRYKETGDVTKINEVLENDIAWGDSLLGRLINSIIRKAKIGVNLVRIDNVIESLKSEFDKLIAKSVIENMTEEEKETISIIVSSSILSSLEESVNNNSDLDIIISITEQLILECDKEENLASEKYKELKKRLEKFLGLIKGKEKKAGDEKAGDEKAGDEKAGDEKAGDEKEKAGDEKAGFKVIDGENKSDVKALDVSKADKNESPTTFRKFESPNDPLVAKSMYRKASKAIHPDRIKDESLKSKANDLQSELNYAKEEGDKTKNYDKLADVVNKINDFLRNNKMDGIVMDSYVYLSYMDFLLENLPVKIDKKEEETAAKDVVDKENKKSIKEIFDEIFDEDYLKIWIVSETKYRTISRKVDNKSIKSNKIVIDGIDPIIEIVKLFNRAYKIHTTSLIPSGRKGGKVSNSVFMEYTYLGSGSGGTPESPGFGPWRNNTLFNKWESAVMDIIKNSKYQVLFNENCVIKVGSADPRVNVIKKDGVSVQGGGKTLLTFINSMLDGSDLYKRGAQAAFIEKYFNVDVSKVPLGFQGPDGSNDTEINSKNISQRKKYSFKNTFDVKKIKEGTIFAISGNSKKNRTYYACALSIDKNYIYVVFSSSFNFLKKIAEEQGDISRGDITNFVIKKDYEDSDGKIVNYRSYLTKFPISKLSKGSKFTIKSFINSNDGSKPSEYEFMINNLYSLLDNDGDIIVIKNEHLKKLKSVRYDKINQRI